MSEPGDAPAIDADLLRRYDRAGPRYTSYPTAPQFTESFGEAQLREHIARSNAPVLQPLSLYVHIPFCASPCFYCGCNRVITREAERGEQYIGRLGAEIERVAPLFAPGREVRQLHLGGGTPNFLSLRSLARLAERLDRHFALSHEPQRDFSIELDPRFLEAGYIAELAQLGFNRASLGVQDFDPVVQRAVNRIQGTKLTLDVIDECRRCGFRSVNVDLIYGLPRQTLAGFRATLQRLIDARPDRLAVYGYAHLPQLFKAQRQIDRADLPSAETRLQLLQLAIEALSGAGYRYIGMDHFALPEDELSRAREAGSLHRNFMGYTTHADCDLLGTGVSAISHIAGSFSQNHRNLGAWERAVDAGRLPVWRGLELDADDVLRAEVIQQLMCRGQIDITALERHHGIVFERYFEDALQRMQYLVDDGLASVDGQRITATERGRFVLRILAMCFDRYLAPAEVPTRPAYSQVI